MTNVIFLCAVGIVFEHANYLTTLNAKNKAKFFFHH
jgi:hypothetical protein